MRMQEQAAALHAVGMLDYGQLKDHILIATAALVATGSSLCYAVGGWEATEPFLAGGVGALVYQRMLQANVDNLGGTQYPKVQDLPFALLGNTAMPNRVHEYLFRRHKPLVCLGFFLPTCLHSVVA